MISLPERRVINTYLAVSKSQYGKTVYAICFDIEEDMAEFYKREQMSIKMCDLISKLIDPMKDVMLEYLSEEHTQKMVDKWHEEQGKMPAKETTDE